jgi:outer membrane protein
LSHRSVTAFITLIAVMLSLFPAAVGAQSQESDIALPLDVKNKHFYDDITLFFRKYGEEPAPGALSIDDSLKIARENSTQLAVVLSRVREASFKIDEVKSLKNPNLGFTGSMIERGPVPTFTLPGLGSFKLFNATSYDMKLTSQYLVTNFGTFENAKKVAYLAYFRTRIDEDRVSSNLHLDVLKSFYSIVETKCFLAVAKEAINARELQYSIAKANYDEGIFPKLEVLNANVNLKQAQQSIIRGVSGLEHTKADMRNVLGLEQTAPFDITSPPFHIYPVPDLGQSIDMAYKNRPEMVQIDLAVDIAKTNIDLAYGGMNPSIVAVATYDDQSEGFGSTPSSWSALMTLQIPIFDGGTTLAKVNQAKESLKQTTLAREQLKREIALQVRNAQINIMENIKKIETEEANLDQAKEAYSIALLRYREGIGTNLELDNALVGYLTSHSTLLSSYCEYHRSWASLLNAIGVLEKGADYVQAILSPEKGN